VARSAIHSFLWTRVLSKVLQQDSLFISSRVAVSRLCACASARLVLLLGARKRLDILSPAYSLKVSNRVGADRTDVGNVQRAVSRKVKARYKYRFKEKDA
jgi:hypothetical protein